MSKQEQRDTGDNKMPIYYRKIIKDNLIRKIIVYIIFILKIGVMYTVIFLSILNNELLTFTIASAISICLCYYEVSVLDKNISAININIMETLEKINESGNKKTTHT